MFLLFLFSIEISWNDENQSRLRRVETGAFEKGANGTTFVIRGLFVSSLFYIETVFDINHPCSKFDVGDSCLRGFLTFLGHLSSYGFHSPIFCTFSSFSS